ncbi:hypothetical protein ACFQH9_04975 [Pseudonocardia lutea]|uniref:Uncharacterized protein n=1 Tax=Pseudonocardia lutea TaxID=2172015 RepID=A0ABW1I5F6_9PSEU
MSDHPFEELRGSLVLHPIERPRQAVWPRRAGPGAGDDASPALPATVLVRSAQQGS